MKQFELYWGVRSDVSSRRSNIHYYSGCDPLGPSTFQDIQKVVGITSAHPKRWDRSAVCGWRRSDGVCNINWERVQKARSNVSMVVDGWGVKCCSAPALAAFRDARSGLIWQSFAGVWGNTCEFGAGFGNVEGKGRYEPSKNGRWGMFGSDVPGYWFSALDRYHQPFNSNLVSPVHEVSILKLLCLQILVINKIQFLTKIKKKIIHCIFMQRYLAKEWREVCSLLIFLLSDNLAWESFFQPWFTFLHTNVGA